MHYSTKANGNLEILKTIKNEGLLIDAMSPLELELVKKAGFKSEEILYVCNNISSEEMEEVSKNNILLCIDSISQVETFGKISPNTDIMIRINPGTKGVGHSKKVITSGKETKFGITEDSLEELFKITNKYNLNIKGVHVHLGSLFLNDKIGDYVNGINTFLDIVTNNFKNIQIIDLGGGFGVPYTKEEQPLNFDLLHDALEPVLKEFLLKNKNINEIKFEPGRYIPCEAGYILGTVTSIKENSGITWIGTDIGMNVLARPAMYDAYHEIEILNNETKQIKANICGNICESGDILGTNRLINKPNIGDAVKVSNAGAYGYSMSSNYTGRLRPAEIMLINKETTKLIRKKETIKDIMKLF